MERQRWTQEKIINSIQEVVDYLDGRFPTEPEFRKLRTSNMIMPKAVGVHFGLTWAEFGKKYFGYKGKGHQESYTCTNCGRSFDRLISQAKKSVNQFCSRSCAGVYNNKHKTNGTSRSKLEIWLKKQLNSLYPTLEIHYNRRDTINAELDIYIPSLRLAFELNGIFHYEPIFGAERLKSIQTNDERKHQACYEAGIEICSIDTSGQKYFKESSSQKYLDIICGVIEPKLPRSPNNSL